MRQFLSFLLSVIIIFGGMTPVNALRVAQTPDYEFMPNAPLLITAYQTADKAQSVAAIEVYNDSDTPIDLAQWALNVVLKDTAGTSKVVNVATAYTGWFLPGEHITYAASVGATFDITMERYEFGIGSVELRYQGTDSAYKPAAVTVKDTSDAPFFRAYTSTGYSASAFAATPERAFYDDGLYALPNGSKGLKIVEVYPYSSDCAPSDTSILCGDYVKLVNTSANDISLDDYVLRTDSSSAASTGSNTFSLAGTLGAGAHITVATTDDGDRLSLTNSGGYIWLADAWGLTRYDDTMTHYAGAGSSERGYAYALAQDNTWVWTVTPQPTGQNIITMPAPEIAECPEGKYRNPDTGRCRTIEEAVNALSACEEGYERNPVTNRCRKIATTAVAALTPCLEGQERNPATNRCRSIASAVAELLPCEEGYERNPATNRCRKVSSTDVPDAAFPVVPVQATGTDMAGWWAFGGVMAIALAYGAWEWRTEIASLARRTLGIFARTK